MVSDGESRSPQTFPEPSKVVRSVCLFVGTPSDQSVLRLRTLAERLETHGFEVQTIRLCSPDLDRVLKLDRDGDGSTFFSVGRVDLTEARARLETLCAAKNVAFNVEIGGESPTREHVELLTDII